jgi:putative DNA primase/helicase
MLIRQKVAWANPTLKKTRSIKDCSTGNWSHEFQIVQIDGKRTRVLVTADDAADTTPLVKRLREKGAQLPLAKAARARLIESVIRAKPEKVVYQLASSGWQVRGRNPPFFSCGRYVVGAPKGAIEYSPPLFIKQSRAWRFATHGTLEAWKVGVAKRALLSTSLTTIMTAAFAAPLLRVSGLQNFTLHLAGLTRVGKTTELIAAMSVYGFGSESDLPNWNATDLRLLEVAAAFGDIPFPLNEVGAKKGKRAQKYEGLRDLYAAYAEGSDRDRHSSHTKDHGGVARHFHGICISTAEHSIAEYAELAGEIRDGGELFRAIDVNATRKGQTTIFDLAPPDLDSLAELQQLRKALAECHGTAWIVYTEYVIAMGALEVKRRTLALINEFVAHMPAAAHDGVVRQLAMHFGLLYAGAIFAIESGILPWTSAHARGALTRAFRDAVEASKPVDPLAMGLDILKVNLPGKVVERKPGSTFGVKDHAGYGTRIGGKKVFVVHARQFRAWFANEHQYNLVVGSLAAKSVSHRWPDGSNVRCVEFFDPFPETNRAVARKGLRKFRARKGTLGA